MSSDSLAVTLERTLWRLAHGAFVLGLRPLARRVSFRTLDRLAMVLAVPVGVLFAMTGASTRRAYLRRLGFSAGPWALFVHSVREARARVQENISYLHPDVKVEVRPGAAAWAALDGASVLVSWSAYGTLPCGLWTASTRCRFVRIPFEGEGAPPPPGGWDVTERWRAEKAAVRHDTFSETQIVPGRSATAYLRALRGGSPLLLLQDVLDPSGRTPSRSLLGLSLPIPTGAARLARAARASVYVLHGGIENGVPWVDVTGPIPADEDVILTQMEAFIRSAPWAWAHWSQALDLAEPLPEADAVPSPASEARPAAPRGATAPSLVGGGSLASS